MTTATDDSAIAPAASAGLTGRSRRPGSSTPIATGMSSDVVGERPEQVLADDRHRGPRQADRGGDAARVAADERDAGGLDRDVGAGADRDPEVGPGERRGVVDAVADHRDRPAAAWSRSTIAALSAGQDLGDDAGGPGCRPAPRRRPRSARASPVTSQTSMPGVAQLADGGGRLGSTGSAIAMTPGDAGRRSRRRRPSGPAGRGRQRLRERTEVDAARSPSSRRLPTTTACGRPLDDVRGRRRPTIASNASTGRKPSSSRVGARATIAAASGCSLPRSSGSREVEHVSGSACPARGTTAGDAGRPSVSVPGLVEDDRVDAVRRSRAPRRRGSGSRPRRRGRCRP